MLITLFFFVKDSAPKHSVHPGQQKKAEKEEEAANESGSDYGGGWSGDEWEDTEVKRICFL